MTIFAFRNGRWIYRVFEFIAVFIVVSVSLPLEWYQALGIIFGLALAAGNAAAEAKRDAMEAQ